MSRTGRLLSVLAVVLVGVSLPAGAGAAVWARTERGVRAFELVSPVDQQVLVRGSHVRLRLVLVPGASLKAVIVPGYQTARLTARLRSAEVPIGGGRRLIRAVVGGLPRGPSLLSFVTTLRGQTAGEQVVVNRVLPAPVIAALGMVKVARGDAPVVRLLPSELAVSVTAKLNGHDISQSFARGAPLVRRVELTPRLGLRAGWNHFSVFVRTFKGSYEQRTVSFYVSLSRVLADAGPARRVRAGLYALLDGSRSLRPARAGKGALRFRWRIVSEPRGAKAQLFRAHSLRAVLRTDMSHPGTYTAELSVSWVPRSKRRAASTASSSSLATTTVEADPQPRVPVDTFASENGQDGIAVGVTSGCSDPTEASSQPCFYANPGSGNELQVLVLDRDTLQPPSGYADYNETYSTSNLSGFASQMEALETAQSGETCPSYNTDDIVIVALRSGSITDTSNFDAGMSVFNVSPSAASASSSSQCTETTSLSGGRFSLVGVPGTLQGKAWTNDGLTLESPEGLVEQPGEITGFFHEVSDDPGASPLVLTYGFTFPDSVYFDTRASGTTGDEVELGPTSPDAVFGNTPVALPSEPSGEGAINVLSFDTVNPQNTLHLEATVSNVGSGEGLNWSELSTDLSDLMANKPPGGGSCTHCGVILVSEGQMGGYSSEPDGSSFPGVLEDLQTLGLDPDTFAQAVNSQGTYSMLSASGIGYAASSVLAEGVDDPDSVLQVYSGTLTGSLALGSNGQLYPLTGDPTGETTASALLPIVYGTQGQWAMTPTLSDVADCPSDTPEPPESGCAASCPAVAFAYVVEQAFPDLFDDEAPTLWGTGGTGDAVSGCGGGSGSPDVEPANVLTAETALRDSYADYSLSFSQAAVLAVQMPSAAPFSSTDFTNAQQQMIAELSDRAQVISTMSTAANVQTNSQTDVTVDLAQVAEDVETSELSSISSEIEAQTESDTSWWIQLGMHWSNGINKVLNFYRQISPFLNSAYLWTGLLGDGSLAVFDTIEGPGGDPADLIQDYVMLAAQLQQQALDVEDQVTNTLNAEANGMEQSEQILLTGPDMMSAFNQAALTTWNFGSNTANVYTAAQNAYLYRVTQLAYEAFWPQAYTAVRFGTDNVCQDYSNPKDDGPYQCWNVSDDKWIQWPYGGVAAVQPPALTGASGAFCGGGYGYGAYYYPFSGADVGSGYGQGTEYHAPDAVATSGGSPGYLDFVMVASNTVGTLHQSVASYTLVEPFFEQPGDTVSDPSSSSSPGFYAPDFWQQNLPVSDDYECATPNSGSNGPWYTKSSVAGYYANQQSWDTWPAG